MTQEELTPELIRHLRDVEGLSQAEIGRRYGMTRAGVSWKARTYGVGINTPRKQAVSTFPWKVPAPMQHHNIYKRLMDHAAYYATSGKGLSLDQVQRLLLFYINLRSNDQVIEFDPELGPTEGIATGGWRYRERSESDNGLMLRLNELSRPMTEEDMEVWKFPDELPRVRRPLSERSPDPGP